MKKSFLSLSQTVGIAALSLIVFSGFSGCDESHNSPKGIVVMAFKGLKSGDHGKYQVTLEGKAKSRFGSPKAMAFLKNYLNGYTNIDVNKPRHEGRFLTPKSRGYRAFEDHYSILVYGKRKNSNVNPHYEYRVLELTVTCGSYLMNNNVSISCYKNPFTFECRRQIDFQNDFIRNCKISDVKTPELE